MMFCTFPCSWSLRWNVSHPSPHLYVLPLLENDFEPRPTAAAAAGRAARLSTAVSKHARQPAGGKRETLTNSCTLAFSPIWFHLSRAVSFFAASILLEILFLRALIRSSCFSSLMSHRVEAASGSPPWKEELTVAAKVVGILLMWHFSAQKLRCPAGYCGSWQNFGGTLRVMSVSVTECNNYSLW